MTKFISSLVALSLTLSFITGHSQTLNWSGFPSGGTSYTTGIMTATITSTLPGFQNGTPKYYAGSTVGSGECGNTGGLALEHNFGNITSAHSLLTLDFTSGGTTSGLCGSISFQIKDINSEESNQTFADWVEVAATNGLNVTVPVANITATGGSNKTISTNGNTRVVVGHSNGSYGNRGSTACDNVTFTVTPETGTTLKTVTIKYHPEYTAAPNDYYNLLNPKRPSYQYVSISPISIVTSSGPTSVQLTTTPASCTQNDGTVLIGAVAGGTSPYQYNFNMLGLNSTSSYSNLAPGSYPIVVQDNNGCTLSVNAVIGSSTGPTAIASTTIPANCGQSNGSVSLGTVSGGTAPYQFNFNNLGLGNETNYNGLAPGNYPVTVQDNTGCTYSTSLTIAPGSNPTAITSTTSPASCGQSNGAVTLGNVSGGSAPYQYNFNNLGLTTSSNYPNVSAGSYSLLVQDNAGCTFSTTIIVGSTQAGPTAIQTSTTNENCGQSNGSLNLGNVSGGIAPYTYNFNAIGFSATQSYGNLSAGTYDLIVTDNNGCAFQTFVIIGSNLAPTAIAITSSNESCGQGNAVLTLGSVTGGTAPYQYNFNNLGYSSSLIFNSLSAGTYMLLVKDINGCVYSTIATIGISSGPLSVTFTTNNTTCGENNGSVSIQNVNGGTSPYLYNLDGTNYTSISSIPELAGGTYTLFIKDVNGCILDSLLTIVGSVVGPTDVILAIISPNCGAITGSLTSITPILGSIPFVYSLDNGTPQNTSNFENISVGSHQLLISDALGCELIEQFVISAPIVSTSLIIPNVFTPNLDGINSIWFVEGSCVNEMDCTIFNRWGNVMKTMTAVSVDWDGIIDGKTVKDGVYFYKLKVNYSNGLTENYHGHITVIY